MIDLKKLKANECVNCCTKEEADELFRIAHKQGIKWADESSLLDPNHRNWWGKDVCYINISVGYISFADLDWCAENNRVVIPFSKLKGYIAEKPVEMTWEEMIETLRARTECEKQSCSDCVIFHSEPCQVRTERACAKALAYLQEPKDPQPIKWEELDKYIGKPVWRKDKQEWLIFYGYKSCAGHKKVEFVSCPCIDWVDGSLYPCEVE